MRLTCSWILALMTTGWVWGGQAGIESQPVCQDLFVGGQDGYDTYRIPSIITTRKGTVLVFCEGRKNNSRDAGDIDMLMRRSTDGGQTFAAQAVIWDDADNTCGNPCVVQDRQTGTLWLFATWNLGDDAEHMIDSGQSRDIRRVFILKSLDDGLTWSKPREITAEVKLKDWRWYATGPGIGIQLQHGPHKGRLLIPGNHSVPRGSSTVSGSQVIYSDDAGATWKLGEPIYPGCNESQAVELSDGRVLMNMRNYQPKGTRAIAISADGGQTWPEGKTLSDLIEPVCQASILRLSPSAQNPMGVIVFSNPHSTDKRVNMTVQASLDDCKTWPYTKSLTAGPAAYSCLGQLPDNRIACLYETGDKNPYCKIVLATFSFDWLMSGAAQSPKP